ncbi:hypothetical protein A33M_0571 [Rhodovulum sp. PH10]|uniref:FxsA family protein n=1 Tax=Rhodovulum sp. PH10 TaxID=1187851 RepID=UPI00027C2499|nr:FxsA family protein [Rhodovulum sp. PH10]EJW13079.1 hypothetical protein A33M_0571 [Rhodovulum sp. PH10]
MKIGKWLLLGVLLLPLAELVAFAIVSALIGGYGATVLVLVGSAIGGTMLYREGPDWLRSLRDVLAGRASPAMARRLPVRQALIAVLLAVPGLLTDAVALALLLPPVRTRLDMLLGRIGPHDPGPGPGAGFRRPPGGMIDLDPDEWERLPDPSARKGRKRRKS